MGCCGDRQDANRVLWSADHIHALCSEDGEHAECLFRG